MSFHNTNMNDILISGILETFVGTTGFYPSSGSEVMYKLMRTHLEGYKELYLKNLIMNTGENLEIEGFSSRIKIILDKLKEKQEKQVKEVTNVLEDINITPCLFNQILEYIFYEFKEDN